MDEAVAQYRQFASYADVASASLTIGADSGPVTVNIVHTQRDLERAEKVKFATTYYVQPSPTDCFSLLFKTPPHELSNEVWNKESRSGKLRAIVRKHTDKANEEKQFIEIWDDKRKIKNIDVQALDKHGKIYSNDESFGSFEWSHSDGHLLYVAEKKYPKSVSFFAEEKDRQKENTVVGESYVVREEWGEGLVGKHHPVICILDVDSDTVSVMEAVPDHISPGLAVWSPGDEGVVFTGWPHEPYRLGMIYCPMRKSAIFYLDIQKATCEQLTTEDRASRCSVFSPDNTSFVFIDNKVGGPHMQCARLLKYDWASKSTQVVVDVVPSAAGVEFAGLYGLGPPRDCWCADSRRMVFNTVGRSQQFIVLVDMETSTITRLQSDGAGNITALCVQNDYIAAVCSAPDTPPYLVLGKLPAAGSRVNWCRLDGEPERLAGISWKVITHTPTPDRVNPKYPSLDYQSILLTPSSMDSSQAKRFIVFPHSGPHASFTTDFNLYASLLCRMGFASLMVNYRGSTGFGNDGIYSLLGNIGDQDVKDVQSAAESVIQSEGYDLDRVVVWGESHGGFLTCHLIGQYPTFYKAAVCRNPVINIATMVGATDIPDWAFTECGLSFDSTSLPDETVSAEMWSRSPLRYVDNVRTPVMLQISLDDHRCPPTQGYQLYRALKARHVPVRYTAYPDNEHPIVKVDSEADAFINIYKWFVDHLD